MMIAFRFSLYFLVSYLTCLLSSDQNCKESLLPSGEKTDSVQPRPKSGYLEDI